MEDVIHEAAQLTARAIKELREVNGKLDAENRDLRVLVSEHVCEIDLIHGQLAKASYERDYYMRECAKLDAKFTDICSLAQAALNEHRQAPFRDNSAPHPSVTKAIEEALDVPKFLTDGRRKKVRITSQGTPGAA